MERDHLVGHPIRDLLSVLDQAVMRLDKADLESSHERVDVIPRIADERDALLVAWQIAPTIGKQQFGWIRLIVKIGRPDRAATV